MWSSSTPTTRSWPPASTRPKPSTVPDSSVETSPSDSGGPPFRPRGSMHVMSHHVLGRDTPRVEDLDPALARRVRLTVSCEDCDAMEKVPNAGQVIEHDGARVQVMHNGVLVEEGGYYGDWMAEIIRV